MKEMELNKICRGCLTQIGDMRPLFGSSLDNMLRSVAQVQVECGDGLPELMCLQCVLQVSRAFRFKRQCERSDSTLRNYLAQKLSEEFSDANKFTELYDKNEVQICYQLSNAEDSAGKSILLLQNDANYVNPNSFVTDTHENTNVIDIVLRDTIETHLSDESTKINQECQRTYTEDICSGTDIIHTVLRENESLENRDLTCTDYEIYVDNSKVAITGHVDEQNKEIVEENTNTINDKNQCDIENAKDGIINNTNFTRHETNMFRSNDSGSLEIFPETNQHSTIHNLVKLHACSICHMKFNEKSELKGHEKEHSHENVCDTSKSLLCSICDIAFKFAYLLSKHLTSYHNINEQDSNNLLSNSNLSPDSTNKDFQNNFENNLLNKKINTSHEDQRTSVGDNHSENTIINTRFTDYEMFVNSEILHITEDRKRIVCQLDDSFNKNEFSIENCENIEQNNLLEINNANCKDKLISNNLLDKIEIDNEIKNCQNVSFNGNLNYEDKNINILKNDSNNDHGLGKYNKTVDGKKSSKKHKKREKVSENETFQCKVCMKNFPKLRILRRHIKIHNPIKPHVCTECGMGFTESSNLTKHKKKHTGELRNIEGKPNLCSVCGKSFKWASSLSKHMNHHTKHKILNCPYCPKYYVEKRSLIIHLRTHTGERPFTCTTCNKSFTQISNLEKHLRIHTGEKPYRCPICDKGFTQSGYVTIHLRSHTGEKPYICHLCGKAFAGSNTLALHKRTHTGERPYACKTCSKTFTRLETTIIHQRTHTGEKPHACVICDRKFTSSSHLSSHLKSHTGVKPYSCEICYKKFARSSSLKVHMKSHTQEKANKNSKNAVFVIKNS